MELQSKIYFGGARPKTSGGGGGGGGSTDKVTLVDAENESLSGEATNQEEVNKEVITELKNTDTFVFTYSDGSTSLNKIIRG